MICLDASSRLSITLDSLPGVVIQHIQLFTPLAVVMRSPHVTRTRANVKRATKNQPARFVAIPLADRLERVTTRRASIAAYVHDARDGEIEQG